MPDMNGPESAQQIPENHKDIRVLFTSGDAGHPLLQHSFPEPHDIFLAKPFDAENLLRKVRDVMDAPKRKGYLRDFRRMQHCKSTSC